MLRKQGAFCQIRNASTQKEDQIIKLTDRPTDQTCRATTLIKMYKYNTQTCQLDLHTSYSCYYCRNTEIVKERKNKSSNLKEWYFEAY